MAKTKAGQKARRSSQGAPGNELYAFAPDGRRFASITPHSGKARLRVWALSSPALDAGHSAPTPTELLFDFVLPDVQAHCISWVSQPQLSRKKRRPSGAQAEPTSRLALGTHDGRVLLLTPSRAAVSGVLVDDSLTEERPVLSIASTGDQLFAGYADRKVRVFDVQEGAATTSSPKLRISLPDTMLPRVLAASPSGLLVGDKDTLFYPLPFQDAPRPTHTFSSHGEPLTHLIWIGPRRFLSTAQGSNEARLYSLSDEGASVTHPDAHMVSSAPLHTLSCFGTDTAGTARVVTVDVAGSISLFLVPSSFEPDASGSKKRRKSKTFTIPSVATIGTTLPSGQKAVDAALETTSSGKTELTLVLAQGGEVGLVTALVRASSEEAFSSIQLADLRPIPAQESEPAVLSIGQALPPSQRDSPVDVEMEMAEPSLESRLKGLDVHASIGSESAGSVTYGISLGKMDSTALARTVTDAVSSNNKATLAELLANSQFPSSVTKGAVKRLVGPVAVQVLEGALQRLDAPTVEPIQSHRLILWIRLVLITHTRYMMTLSPLVDRLAELNAKLEARLKGKDKFTELQGRLDLILAQLEVRAQLAQAEAYSAEGEVAQGQEEGDVQDIALGADESGPESAEEEQDEERDDDDGSEAMEDNALESSSAPDEDEEKGEGVDVSEDEEDEDEADEAGSLEDFIVDGSDDESDDSEDESSEEEEDEEEEPRSNGRAPRSKAARALLDDEAEEASDDESE